jgi:glycosidase
MEAFFLGGTGNDGEDGVIPHWMRTGIAGWRTDVTPWITDEFWRRFRQVVRAIDNEAFIIAEDWGDCTPRFLGDTFDATMNYRFGYSVLAFANGTLSPSALDDRLETMRRDYGEPFFQAQINLLDSHDTGRALSYLGGDMQRLRLAVALQLGYPGVPTIFAGDEAGAQGHNMDEGRVPFPWGREDASLLAHYRKAIHARRASNALSLGDVEAALIDDAHGVYGFWRTFENERVLVLLNTSDGPQTVAVPAAACAHAPHLLLGDGDCVVEGDLLHATLPARAAAWVQMRC